MGVEISSPPGTVTGEGETPSHPAKGNFGLSGKEKSGATGEGETPSHPAKDSSRLSGKEKSGATGEEETPSHPVLGRLWGLWSREKPGATRQEGNPQGGTSSHRRRENFKVCGGGETLKSRNEKKTLGRRRRENFKLRGGGETLKARDEKKALSHPAKGKLEPFGLGETPVIWLQESSEPLAEEVLGATRLGGNPGLVGKEEILQSRRGEPRATR
jgi:hypothetical protein